MEFIETSQALSITKIRSLIISITKSDTSKDKLILSQRACLIAQYIANISQLLIKREILHSSLLDLI